MVSAIYCKYHTKLVNTGVSFEGNFDVTGLKQYLVLILGTYQYMISHAVEYLVPVRITLNYHVGQRLLPLRRLLLILRILVLRSRFTAVSMDVDAMFPNFVPAI